MQNHKPNIFNSERPKPTTVGLSGILNGFILLRQRLRRVKVVSPAFTIVEILIIAPIVILVIGIFITAIVSMTGDVLSTRGSDTLSYNIQDALSRIKQDVQLSSAYLATNDITLASPQGYNDDTTDFHNANTDSSIGTVLILKTYATTSNPLSSTQNIMYLSGQPNACSSPSVNQNTPLMLNTIYFVKNNTLWRRVIAPSYYATVGCVGSSIGAPWQQPSCAIGVTGTMCKAQDERLVDGIQNGGFSVDYYTTSMSTTANTTANDSSQADNIRQAAIQTSSTIGVTINATDIVAGRDINQSGAIRANSPNNTPPIDNTSCYSILNTGRSIGDGVYWIKPAGTSIQAYCDMQNGGWTRLNNNLATSTTPFNGSDVLITNNVPGGCGTPGCAFTIDKISVPHNYIKVLLIRTTSIVQCASISGMTGGDSSYWSGTAWISYGMCNWGDLIFANVCCDPANMTGLKLSWKMEGKKAANGAIKLFSECSGPGGTDIGQVLVTAWVK